jgi:hypothetical protein
MSGPKLYVVLPDQQIPYLEKPLHECVLRWLEVNKSRLTGKIYSGDLIDLPGISRHDWSPDMDTDPFRSTNNALKDTRKYLDECNEATGGPGDDHLTMGNHEKRMEAYLIKNADRLYYVTEEDGEQTISLERILGLKKRGVTVAPGGWPAAKVWLSPKLAVMHGWFTGKYGAAAKKTIDKVGHSAIVGHTHGKAVVYKTTYPHKGAQTIVGVEAGTLARLNLGYDPYMDAQQGFEVVRVFADGTFSISPATYVRGVLRWEDQEITYNRRGLKVVA